MDRKKILPLNEDAMDEDLLDLDIDSLSMVEVVMACEDKFGVTIPDTEVKNLNTVGDAVNYITNCSYSTGSV